MQRTDSGRYNGFVSDRKHGSAEGLKCYRRERTKPWYTVIFQLQGIISRAVRSAERPVNTRLSSVAVLCPRGVLRGVKA